MSEIIDKLRSNPYNEVEKHHYNCPCCGGDLYTSINMMAMVYDGNTVYHCENDKDHKFWVNARERGEVLHQNKRASETDWHSEKDWYLYNGRWQENEPKIKKVSFDFDGTLSDGFFGDDNPEEDEVKKLFRNLYFSDYFEVFIITRRFGPEHADLGQKNEHEKVFELLNSLHIQLPEENLIFTNRKYKFSWINKLGIDIHFDDDPQEHALIRQYSNGSSVDVKANPNWKNDFDELL